MASPILPQPVGPRLWLRDRGRFTKGGHWREPQPYWSEEWLRHEYIDLGRSSGDIAAQFGCTDNNIHYWLEKHGIARRNTSEARRLKRWGARGPANPQYVDGCSKTRLASQTRSRMQNLILEVRARDGNRCVRCGEDVSGKRAGTTHHIAPWAGNPELRYEKSNIVTLCRPCHLFVHSVQNVSREYLSSKGGDLLEQY